MKQQAVTLLQKTLLRRTVVWPLLIISIIFGWQSYLMHIRALDIPSENLLYNGSFEKVDSNAVPSGWLIQERGEMTMTVSSVEGYVDGKGLRVDVSDYVSGNLEIGSPWVDVQPGKHYFFKSYYLTDAALNVHVRVQYEDGSEKLLLAKHYPDYDYPWSTMSAGITADSSMQRLSFVVSAASNGYIELDAAYVNNNDTEAEVRECAGGSNLVPNPALTLSAQGKLTDWEIAKKGNNSAIYEVVMRDNDDNYLRTTVADYIDGEARWDFALQPVKPHQAYCFGVEYRADTVSSIYAEYIKADGSVSYDFIADLYPSADWTKVAFESETPEGATAFRLAVAVSAKGTVETGRYVLQTISDDVSTFSRPLISITFDDGWLSSYINGARLLDEYGMRGTFYINPAYINQPLFMTRDNLQMLINNGHQIASHGHRHIDMTSFNSGKIEDDLSDSKKYIETELGLRDIDFASPYGKHDAVSNALFQKYYVSHRGTSLGVNTKRNFNPYDLKVLFVRQDTPTSEVVKYIESARSNRAWLILVYHQIEDFDSMFIVSEQVLREHLDAIVSSGIEVRTVRDAFTEYSAQL